MFRSLTRALRLGAEPPVLAVERIVRRATHRAWSRLYGAQLGASGAHFGSRAEVRGGRHIGFGVRFSAGSDLWLEAVTSYGDQRFTPEIAIGDDVSFSNRVHVTAIESIRIGNGCLFGSGVYVADHNHGSYRETEGSAPSTLPARRPLGGGGPVRIGERVWVGDNAVLVGPLTIGDGAVVGANSVVTHDVPAGVIVAGVPARPIKRWDASAGWERV